MPGRLILCATPIGNLGDVSRRLAETVASADLVYAEDTRRTRALLGALRVDKPLRSFFAGNEDERAQELARELEEGKTIALLTDAGTPTIADPGLSAVRAARAVGATVTIVPGPSAVTTALAVSGLPSERFVFEGFLPRKGKARRERLAALATEPRTAVVFAGSAHVLTDLRDLAAIAPHRQVCVARELTKAFEEIQWASAKEAVDHWQERTAKGEFTLVIAGADPPEADMSGAVEEVLNRLEGGAQPMAAAVKEVATKWSVSRRELYEAVLVRTRDTNPER